MRPMRPRRLLPAVALPGVLLAAACEPKDTTAVSIFRPPPPIEGNYAGSVVIEAAGGAGLQTVTRDVTLALLQVGAANEVRGTLGVSGTPPGGSLEGTFVVQDSSVSVQRLGPAAAAALGWAAFLPPVFPQCDWTSAEAVTYRAKFDLPVFHVTGRVVVPCTDARLTGAVRGPVTMDVVLRVQKADPGPPPPS
jgi:hypothetical protein